MHWDWRARARGGHRPAASIEYMMRLAWTDSQGHLQLDSGTLVTLRLLPGPLCVVGLTAAYEDEQLQTDAASAAPPSVWMHVSQATGKAGSRTVVVICANTQHGNESNPTGAGIPIAPNMSHAQLKIVAFLMLTCSTIVHSRCVLLFELFPPRFSSFVLCVSIFACRHWPCSSPFFLPKSRLFLT